MNRRDVILAAVFINLGLLSLLFFFAINTEDEKISDIPAEHNVIVMAESQPPQSVVIEPIAMQTEPGDEVDNALKEYTSSILTHDYEEETPEPVVTTTPAREAITTTTSSSSSSSSSTSHFVDVTIKRGDALEKIARANNTTVEAIKQANHLTTDRVYIGQALKIPVGTAQKQTTAIAKATQPAQTSTDIAEAQYYVIKSGDNPWKIAKQYNVKFDDLLKLNNLDEEKARNLKIGERIRVR